MKNLALAHLEPLEPLNADNHFEMHKPVRPLGGPAHFAGRSLSTEEGDLPERPFRGAALNRVKTVMVLCENAATRRFLSGLLHRCLSCRVLEAATAQDARYLAAVESNIGLLVTDTLSAEAVSLAQLLSGLHSETKLLVADDSLWSLSGAQEMEPVLLAKSYTARELLSTVRRMIEPKSTMLSADPLPYAAIPFNRVGCMVSA